MAAPEPGEPLLLYIVATAEAVSMVLVGERPDPHNPHELGSSSASGSGSQDLGLVEEPRAGEAARSQLPEICSAHGDTRSQPPEAASGPDDQMIMGPWTDEALLNPEDRELPEPVPMEIDARDPPGEFGQSNDQCTTSMRSSTMPKQGTWRSTSCFMQYSSPSGSCATTSMLTRSWWCPHTH
jgi:hypothetical protein